MIDDTIDKHIEAVVEEVVEDIGIETCQTNKRRIKHRVVLLVHLIIVFGSFIKCCNNVKKCRSCRK